MEVLASPRHSLGQGSAEKGKVPEQARTQAKCFTSICTLFEAVTGPKLLLAQKIRVSFHAEWDVPVAAVDPLTSDVTLRKGRRNRKSRKSRESG